jgi:hypothetical protein
MRDSDQIRAEISEVQARLETVGQDIQRKQQDLTKLKDSHVQWVESNIGKERLPKSVGKQRQSLLTLGLEIENLEVVRDKIEGKLADLQRELYRSELYEHQVQAYKQAEQQFADKAEMVLQEIVDLNKRMQSCKESVEKFMQESGSPLEILKSLHNDPALSDLSLRNFFAGQIVEIGSDGNAIFVQELVKVYRELSQKLPILNSIKSDWVQLSNHLDFMSRTANDLTPRSIRYNVSDQSPPPAQKTSQAIHIQSRNLAVDANRKRELDAVQRRTRGIRVVNANKTINASQ